MALPSERITIKRKIDEEPVEVLYLQPAKRQRSFNFYWNRVTDSQALDSPVSIPFISSTSGNTFRSASNVPQVPKIRTTSPDEDHINGYRIQLPLTGSEKRLSLGQRPKTPIPSNLKASSQKKPLDVIRSNVGPRRFHFIKTSSSTYLHTIGPANKVKKYRKGRRSDLPVFIEKLRSRSQPETTLGVLPRIGDDTRKEDVEGSSVAEVYEQRPRKRPRVNAAERRWRTENWGNSTKADHNTDGKPATAQNIKESSSQWDHNSEVLVGQLQNIVFQETNAARATAQNGETAPQLRAQSKSPEPRQLAAKEIVDASTEDESMMEMIDNEHDNRYVYETYVRSVAPPANTSAEFSEGHMDRLQSIDNSKIGILVIAEEDQEEWETFAEGDQDSDKDWNSEEEDENAEDYYGNDYPEDEVNSDDEFDRGAYNYRAGASDEEEFDQDADSWSDEDEEQYPWKPNAGTAQSKGDDHGDQDMED